MKFYTILWSSYLEYDSRFYIKDYETLCLFKGKIWKWKPINSPFPLCKNKKEDKTNIPNLGFINQIWLSIFAYNLNVNPIQDGGDKKALPTSFSAVTFTNIRISPQNFLTFSFNLFATLIQNFKFIPSTSPKLLNLNQNHLKKKQHFCWHHQNFNHVHCNNL